MSERPTPDLPPEPDYVAEVEARISELRRAPLVLSTRDWQRVCGWRRQGIPLPVVLRALDDVLRSSAKEEDDARPPSRSLAYCERAVQQHWNAKREAWVGRAAASVAPPRRVRTSLNALARQIGEAAGKARRGPCSALALPLRKLASRLRELARRSATEADPFDDLGPALRSAESTFHHGLREALGADWGQRCALERERLKIQLVSMSAGAAAATIEAAVLRRLRQQLGVPGFDLGAVHARLQSGRRRLTARSESV